MGRKRIIILCLVGRYLPGYKSGGPIRTIANMVDRLGDEFDFKIVTEDRDSGDTKPYPGIRAGAWNRVGKADVFYMAPARRSLRDFRQLLSVAEYDILYLNSFFSPHFTIKPLLLRRLGLIPKKPLVIAPRGEFSQGALGLKSLKKYTYLRLARATGLYKDCLWQASSEHEKADIQRVFGNKIHVAIAPNLPPALEPLPEVADQQGRKKAKGRLKIIFVSRISRKKNLDGALRMLKGVKGAIEFDIYGPEEDGKYWAECQEIIRGLPDNITVEYRGSIPHEHINATMKEHDIFFLPTLGENFGHVILEALSAGCPVLISDQTPWRDLEPEKAGWDLDLSRPQEFQSVLQGLADMDHTAWRQWSRGARQRAERFVNNPFITEANRRLFYEALKNAIS